MIILFIIGIPAICLVIWLYLKFSPAGTSLISRLGFEVTVLMAEISGCVYASYYSYSTTGQSADSAWWPVIAFLYCFIIIPSILILAAIIRHLIYKNKHQPDH